MKIMNEINKRRQKQAIKDMKKICKHLLPNEALDNIEDLALFVTDEEVGHYPQSPSAGRRMFICFLMDELKK